MVESFPHASFSFASRLTPCASLQLPSSAPIGSFHPTRFCPYRAHTPSGRRDYSAMTRVNRRKTQTGFPGATQVPRARNWNRLRFAKRINSLHATHARNSVEPVPGPQPPGSRSANTDNVVSKQTPSRSGSYNTRYDLLSLVQRQIEKEKA